MLVEAAVPARRARQRRREVPDRMPAQLLAADAQSRCSNAGLVRMRRAVDPVRTADQCAAKACTTSPTLVTGGIGPEVPGPAQAPGPASSRCAEKQVARQGLEHVLPGPRRAGVADRVTRPARAARTRSGTSRSSDQSPPPMTLPARAVARATAAPSPGARKLAR